MKTTLATIAIAVIALTGCNTGPGVPDVEVGDAIAQDAGSPVEVLR